MSMYERGGEHGAQLLSNIRTMFAPGKRNPTLSIAQHGLIHKRKNQHDTSKKRRRMKETSRKTSKPNPDICIPHAAISSNEPSAAPASEHLPRFLGASIWTLPGSLGDFARVSTSLEMNAGFLP